MFEITWTEKAYEQLNKLDGMIAHRILKKLDELSQDPFSKDIRRLKGERAYRMRIGDYRVIFDIDKNKLIILILRVGHRKKIY